MGNCIISENVGAGLIITGIIVLIVIFSIPFFTNVGNVGGIGGVVDTANWYVILTTASIGISFLLFFIGAIPFIKNDGEKND